MRKISKRYKKFLDTNVNQENFSSVEKIIDKVKAHANAKFVESIDISFKINLKKIKKLNLASQVSVQL